MSHCSTILTQYNTCWSWFLLQYCGTPDASVLAVELNNVHFWKWRLFTCICSRQPCCSFIICCAFPHQWSTRGHMTKGNMGWLSFTAVHLTKEQHRTIDVTLTLDYQPHLPRAHLWAVDLSCLGHLPIKQLVSSLGKVTDNWYIQVRKEFFHKCFDQLFI